uniref:Cna B-type domain-containing protein n=1 Tax=Peptostreptococcus russellii TaxID=215200 RepID=UPI003F58FC62
SGYVITNTQDKPLIPLEPALRSIKVSKDWKDSEGKEIDPKVENIMVELYKNGSATGNKLELNKENNWSAEFTKLKVSETVGGENNEYIVKEVNGEDGKIKISDKWYKVSVSGNMSEGFKIVNTQNRPLIPIEPALRSIKVSKDWKDSEGKV